jgi:hypothetical protein
MGCLARPTWLHQGSLSWFFLWATAFLRREVKPNIYLDMEAIFSFTDF